MTTCTPLIRHYLLTKQEYLDSILLYQVGDFFELFFDDATQAASILAITLTQRGTHNGEPIPLCGFPLHVADTYIARLVKAGLKVAVCEQQTNQIPGKIIERSVTRVLTPGTLTDSSLLAAKASSYLAALHVSQDAYFLLCAELLTGSFFITRLEKDKQRLEAELVRFDPDEIVLEDNSAYAQTINWLKSHGYVVTSFSPKEEHGVLVDPVKEWIKTHAAPSAHSFFTLQADSYAVCQLLYAYLIKNHSSALASCKKIQVYRPEDFLMLDAQTQRNLELVQNKNDGTAKATLFDLLDLASTSMGSRMLKRWLVRPLVQKQSIEQRLDAIDYLLGQVSLRQMLTNSLKAIGDSERVIGRIALGRAMINDYVALKKLLAQLPDLFLQLEIQETGLSIDKLSLLKQLQAALAPLPELTDFLVKALSKEPLKGACIASGYNAELDRIRGLANDGNQALLDLEAEEQRKTGISSLKIRYNSVHGYALEVTKAHLDSVPEHYVRLQILAGKDRFTIPALKELEYTLSQAALQAELLDKTLFEELQRIVFTQVKELRVKAQALALIDSLLALSAVAERYNYVRPTFNSDRNITIVNGRHPVIAAQLQSNFIANSTQLNDTQSLFIITGPNMGGKSTYLRQTALICLLAQMGSFVPAEQASLPILDRIFTRIGAGDNLAQGKSTFYLEMEETALICKQATEKSLVILDEVGRGTSTVDGLALAQAIAEYMHHKVKARCLFATHYHELTVLAETTPGIAAYHAATQKNGEKVALLHTIVPGAASSSFGLEVALSADLPYEIIQRARELQNN
jgi:DNA mismatch repair protein MutS